MRERLAASRKLPWALAVAALALLVRIPLLGDGTGWVDTPLYERLAASLLRGDGFSSNGHVFGDSYRTPGYPILLAGFRLLPGSTAAVTGTMQHLLGAAFAVGVLLVAWRFFGRSAGVIAGVLLAISPLQLFVEHAVLPDLAFGVVAGVVVALVAELAARDRAPTRFLVGAGVLVGVATYIKPNGLILVPLVPLAFLLARLGWRPGLRATGIFAATALVVVAPWVIRNWVREDTPLLTTQGGAALWVVAFDSDRMPFPSTEGHPADERVAIEAARRARVFKLKQGLTPLTYAQVFSALRNGGDSATEAANTMTAVGLRAISEHPGLYLDGARHVLDMEWTQSGDADWGAVRLDQSLRRTGAGIPAVTDVTADVAGVVFDVWWVLTLGGVTAIALLFARDRRVRAGGATLVGAWVLLSVGTAMTNTFDLRYVAQVAPLAWIGGTAGTVLLVRRAVLEVRTRRAPARAV
jgi:hypothetical protein